MRMAGAERFIQAQKCYYNRALGEIRNGRKESNWIIYIFPQVKGLGFSSESNAYGIDGREEAREYLANGVLRERLLEMCRALLGCGKDDISDIMDYPDDRKVCSCMTLFGDVCPEEPVFGEVLAKFFGGEADEATLEILNG